MNEMIRAQLHIFFFSIIIGGISAITYDFLRALRAVIDHSKQVVNLQDSVYFIGLSFFLFHYIFKVNSGEIRGFIFIGFIIGALVYYLFMSKTFVALLEKIVYLFIELMKILFAPIYYLWKILRKIGWRVKKYLKNLGKWLIIKTVVFLKQIKNMVTLN